ncbi:MAG TPA: acylphosphatase [Tepidisphaeraceae bacterium]|nr:acylphosphatase [Tepidisphaeraceae bacterium]
MVRRRSIFIGHVQGVGFRYTAQDVARGFDVTGYVRNLPDGRVELVAEGEREQVGQFLGALGQRMDGFIKRRLDDDAPPTGEFSDFSVRR